jgi:hypothetical protein
MSQIDFCASGKWSVRNLSDQRHDDRRRRAERQQREASRFGAAQCFGTAQCCPSRDADTAVHRNREERQYVQCQPHGLRPTMEAADHRDAVGDDRDDHHGRQHITQP